MFDAFSPKARTVAKARETAHTSLRAPPRKAADTLPAETLETMRKLNLQRLDNRLRAAATLASGLDAKAPEAFDATLSDLAAAGYTAEYIGDVVSRAMVDVAAARSSDAPIRDVVRKATMAGQSVAKVSQEGYMCVGLQASPMRLAREHARLGESRNTLHLAPVMAPPEACAELDASERSDGDSHDSLYDVGAVVTARAWRRLPHGAHRTHTTVDADGAVWYREEGMVAETGMRRGEPAMRIEFEDTGLSPWIAVSGAAEVLL